MILQGADRSDARVPDEGAAFDGLLPSTRYPGGMALRFARVRAHRPDKDPEAADTSDTVREIFRSRR